ncbi:MAG: DNA-processing protein DprA [Nitrospiraceae bacterium]
MNAASLRAWLALCGMRELGDATVCCLVQAFGSPEAVRAASTEALMASGSLSAELAKAIQAGPDHETGREIEDQLKALERVRCSVVTWLDPVYPPRLRQIPDPPPLLYVSGALEQADHHAVAIVGSRHATAAGRVLTERLSRELASAGFTIVSGLAHGIDAAAHRGALSAPGRTVAVLGCGIDRTYPPDHQALRKQIESSGAVVSEFPIGSYPHAYHFPRRNRIISGMCLGVLVTEAAAQSGSLITARLAAEQGREVFAVPGFIAEKNSHGPNGLIKQGAKLVEQVEDIIEELLPQLDGPFQERLQRRPASRAGAKPRLGTEEAAIYDLLSPGPTHIDDLIARTGLPAADVSSALLSIELKGLIRQLPGHSYIRML